MNAKRGRNEEEVEFLGHFIVCNVRLYRYRSIDRAFYCTACLRGGSVCDPDRFDASYPDTGGLRDCQQADCRGTVYDRLDFGEGDRLECHRTKGLRKVEHNDIVIFNFPINRRKYKMEFKINYVYAKRCIGLPGDTVRIRNGYFRNSNYDGVLGVEEEQRRLSETPDSLIADNVLHAFPFDFRHYGWTVKEFGPLYVPRAGGQVMLDTVNFQLYRLVIEYETGEKLRVDAQRRLTLGGKPIDSYTFQGDYYFFCGDQVLNSNDSRYWGFVPEEFIVGVVTRITYSRDRESGEFRWDRLLKSLKK